MTEETSYLKQHPQELLWISLTELCQRFGFWGIANTLVLYLTREHQVTGAFASQVYGIFAGTAFLLPILGGYIADKWNYKYPIIISFIFSFIGCLLFALEVQPLLYPSLALIAIGVGLFTPSILTLLGRAYTGRHHLRATGFTLYYMSINIGVFLAMIILGYMIEYKLWTEAYYLTAIVQILGLLAFFKTLTLFKAEDLLPAKLTTTQTKKGLSPEDKERMTLIYLLSIVVVFFWCSYSQNFTSLILFSSSFTDRLVGSFTVPPTWIPTSELLFLLLFGYPLTKLYSLLKKKKIEPSPIGKMAAGLFAMGLTFFVMIFASYSIPFGAKTAEAPIVFPLLAFFFMSFSELLFCPIGMSFVMNISPPQCKGFVGGLWYFCSGIAFCLGGYIAGLFTILKMSNFFTLISIILFIVALVVLFFRKRLERMMHLETFENCEDPSS